MADGRNRSARHLRKALAFSYLNQGATGVGSAFLANDGDGNI
jgi:hypothetical protein